MSRHGAWICVCRHGVHRNALQFLLVLLCVLAVTFGLTSKAQDTSEADSLNKQVIDLYRAGKYQEAIPIAREFLEISEKINGPDHPDTATSLNNLAQLYQSMSDYAKAEPLFQRALAIREKALGPDHPDIATSLNDLAALYQYMGDYAKAEPLLRRALAIYEKGAARRIFSLTSDGTKRAICMSLRDL